MEKNRSFGKGNETCENIDSLLYRRSNVEVGLLNGTASKLSRQIVVGNSSVSNAIDKETSVVRSGTKIGNDSVSLLKLLLSDKRTKTGELVRRSGSVAQFHSFMLEMYARFASGSQRCCPLMKAPAPKFSVPREVLCEFVRAFMRIGLNTNCLAVAKKQARCAADMRKSMFPVLALGDFLKLFDDNDRLTNSSNRTPTQFVAEDFRSPKRKRAATPEQPQQCRVASWSAVKRKRYCGKLQTVPWSGGGNAGGSCSSGGKQRDYDSMLEYQLLDSSSSPSTSVGYSGSCSPYTSLMMAKEDAANERDSEMFDEENYASSTNETLTVDDEDYEPSEDDTESSLLSYESFDDDEDPTKRRSVLRIYHTYRDSYNREHTRLEVTRNRAIIDYYMKIMSKKGKRKVEREKSKDCNSTDAGRHHCASQNTVPIAQRVVQSDTEESLTRNYYQSRGESHSGGNEYVNVTANDCSSVSRRPSNISGVAGYCDDDDDDDDDDVEDVVEKKRKRAARERRVSSSKSQKTTEERCCADGSLKRTTDEQQPKHSAESEEDEYFAMERLTSRLIAIWDEIDIQSNGQPYRFPIDAEKEPKYYQTVKNPMSLAAMLDNLNNRLYQDRVSFLSDVDQITRNSEVYYDETNKICIFYAQVILQTCVTRLIEYDEELTKCERAIDPLSSADNNRRFVLSVVLRSILRKIKEMPEIEEYLKLLSQRPADAASAAEQDSDPILDLDLIENRIYSCVYSSRTEFLTDLQIMHIDCATVHGPESVHAQNAQIVFNMFCANFEVYGSILQLLENKFNQTVAGQNEKRALSPQSMMSSSPLLSPPLLSPQLISPEPLSPRPLSPQPLSPGGDGSGGTGGGSSGLFNVDSADEYSGEARYKKIKLAVDRQRSNWSLEHDSYVSDADDECTNDACPPRFQKFYALNRDSATAATEIIIEHEQIDSDPEQQAQLLSATAPRKESLPNIGDHRPKEFRSSGRSADCCRPISPIYSELEEFIKVDKLVSTTNKR